MKTNSTRKNAPHNAHQPNRAAPKGSQHESSSLALRTRLHGRFMLGSLAVLGSIILFNALALQKERHPSPLFQPLTAPKPTYSPVSLAPSRQEAKQEVKQEVKQEQAALTHIVKKQTADPIAAVIVNPLQPAPMQAYPLPQASSKDALAERIANAEKQKPNLTAVIEADSALMIDLQRELKKRGHYKGEIDGRSGPMLTQAIRSFQFSQRVAVDGKASEALLREVRKSKIPPKKDELQDLIEKNTQPSSISQRAPNKTG